MAKKENKVYSQSGKYIGEHVPGSGGVVKQAPSNRLGRQWGDKTAVTKQQHYGMLGYGSVRPEGAKTGQGAMDLGGASGVAAQEFKPLRSWHDFTDEKKARISQTMESKFGVTMESAIHHHGALIDAGFDRGHDRAVAAGAHPLTSSRMEGQGFYAGGEGSDRKQVADLARQHGVPFEVAAGVRAAVSPRIKLPGERRSAANVFEHVAVQGKSPQENISGVGIQGNARSGAFILQQHLESGTHPLEAMEPSYGKAGEGKGKPRMDKSGNPIMKKALSGPKVEGYMQGYTNPHHPDTRTAMDVHATEGMTPHLPGKPGKWTDPKDGKEKSIPQSHPDWRPNTEDLMKNVEGATEFFNHAAHTAAKIRGLDPTEGQAGAWFQQRGVVRGIKDEPVSTQRGPKGTNVSQPGLFNDRRQ
jgi:hypothetical protein